MSIEYHIKADADYFKAVRDRVFRQRPFLLRMKSQAWIMGICFSAFWVYGFARDGDWTTAAMIGILGGVALGLGLYHLTNFLVFDKLRGGGRTKEATVVLSEEGVSAQGQIGHSLQRWDSYPRAVRFSDGILLLRRGVVRWLPDSMLRNGTAEEATALVAAKTKLKRIA